MVTSAAATPKAAAAWRARAASLPLQPFSPARLQQPLGGRRGHVATREKLRCAASTSSSGGGGGSSGSAALPQQQSAARSSVPAGAAASTPSVCVVGGGVIGLTSALRIKQALPAAEVTVVAEAFEATTSHGAAGLWKPYTLGDTPAELANRWGAATLDHYLSLYQSPEAPAAGVLLTSAFQLFLDRVPDPEWATVVPHFRHLTAKERAVYDPEGTHPHGWFYTTAICEGALYLAWLRRQLEAAGARLQARRVAALPELAGHDVVVNCTGLGAKELAGDPSCYPVRGHVLRVRAPWVRHYTNCQAAEAGRDTYIIPNADTVVLGGTLGKDDWDTVPRPQDRAAILQAATRVVPSLAAAEVVAEWVGLRPGRPSVRLELERLPLEGGQGSLPVVHNYGHGGAGLTLAWGCAADAAALVQQALAGR